jgi:hypothetical protein
MPTDDESGTVHLAMKAQSLDTGRYLDQCVVDMGVSGFII